MADLRLRHPAHARSRPTTTGRRSGAPGGSTRRDTLEFPPSAAYGNVYLAQQKGLFFALNGKTGKPVFKTKNFKRCAASSPTLANGTIYQSYMDFVACRQGDPNPTGFLIAMDAKTGRQKWRFKGQPIESSPLLRNGHALRRLVGRQRATRSAPRPAGRSGRYETGNRVNTSAAYSNGRIFIANDSGTLYALNARTGKLAWSGQPGHRVLLRRARRGLRARVHRRHRRHDVRLRAKSGKLLWATPARHLHLLVGRDLRPQGLRRHLRRQVLRARRRHRRRALAARHAERRARAAGRDGRSGLRVHLRHLRLGGGAVREDGHGLHDRVQRPHRQDGAGATTPASTRARSSPTRTASTSRAARTCTRWS